ncbi:MAG TPA: hypothetical protein VG104_04165 [Candidatus Dormibacteraeota bacterium]|jgi:hypothetical protein|nr:hypothetical protein [Candidatus Dormibacteraeota bacterium]
MSAIERTHPTGSSAEQTKRRRWRRRQIMTTYAAYVGAVILMSVRAHVTLGAGLHMVLTAVFLFAFLAFIVSLVWLVGPSVRYGLSTRSHRQPAPAELKMLREQGVSAKQAHVMLTRPADERQRAIAEHARAVSYQILAPVVTIVALYLIYAPQLLRHLWLPSTQIEQVALLAGFALLYSTLPAAVIAWSEPDPVPDDVT